MRPFPLASEAADDLRAVLDSATYEAAASVGRDTPLNEVMSL